MPLEKYIPDSRSTKKTDLKRSIINNEIETTVKSVPKKKGSGSNRFSAEFYQTFK
jgi:hypothetical protein